MKESTMNTSIGSFDSKLVSTVSVETPKINITSSIKASEVTPALSSPATLVTLSQSQSQLNDVYSRKGISDKFYTPVTQESKVNLQSSLPSASDIQISSQNQKKMQNYVDIQQAVYSVTQDQSEKSGTTISFLS